jgi:hypothetical protein
VGGRWRGRVDCRQTILDLELAPRPKLKGFTVRLMFQDEAPKIGSGQRTVLCQFRGKRVVLHSGGFIQIVKRKTFKELVAENRLYRSRNDLSSSVRVNR